MNNMFLGFLMIVAVLFAAITGLTMWFARYIVKEAKLRRVRTGILVWNMVSLVGIFMGYSILRDVTWLTGIGGQIISGAFMVQLIMLVLTILAVLSRNLYCKLQKQPVDRQKRKLLKQAAVIPAAALAAGMYGNMLERNHTVDRYFDISVKGLDDRLEGFRIAQLSDVHIGLYFSLDRLHNLLERIADTGAAALVITGDIFDDVKMNRAAVKMVDDFCDRFEKGIWFCYGNHEHMRGIEQIKAYLKETKIKVLANANSLVVEASTPLYFMGVDYPFPRSEFEKLEKEYTAKAAAGIPDDAVKIMLAHHPIFFDDGAEHGAKLVLSGHTHGGQLGIMGVPLVPPVFKYMRGMYKIGDTYGYVHSGNGSWFPYRLGCPPEVAYFTLKSC